MSLYIVTRNNKKYCFRKTNPEHKLQKPAGWSFNVEYVENMKKQGVNYIVVVAEWEGRYYFCDLETFLQKAIIIDRGYGRQLALPERYWKVLRNLRELERGVLIA